jgi:phosphoribosylaminoimidazole carboxylase PurE protein
MKKPQVSIVMGSDSDLDIMKEAARILTEFNIAHEVQILSAHRSPDLVSRYAKDLTKRGISVVIAGAGGAAHLAGVIAAHAIVPVIGVPIDSSALNGLDSLLAIVQMPAGIPVGTMSIGKAGAINGAILAAQILAQESKVLQKKLIEYKAKLEKSVVEKNNRIQGTL